MKIKLYPGSIMPERKTQGSSGYDLFSVGSHIVHPKDWCKISTGVAIQLPYGEEAIVTHRSGHNSKQGIFAYGTIDRDYRGIISVTLFNFGTEPFVVHDGMRFAQMKLAPIHITTLEPVSELDATDRGEDGHGSTGD